MEFYQYVKGDEVHPKMRHIEWVPVPPAAVRERGSVPEACQYACLAKELEWFYPSTAREVCVRYVKEYFQMAAKHGSTLVLVGSYENMKARSWLASAVINEIVTRFRTVTDVSSGYLTAKGIRGITGLKGGTGFLPLRAQKFDVKHLLILEPQQVEQDTDDGRFLADVFEHRWHFRLPTVVTITAEVGEEWAKDLYPVLGPATAEMLRDTCHDYFVRY